MIKKPRTKTIASSKPKILRPVFSPISINKIDPIQNTPSSSKKTEIENEIIIPQEKKLEFPVLPMLITASNNELDDLFIQKCKQCYQICDFSKPQSSADIIAKTDVLNEILNVLKENFPEVSGGPNIYKSIFGLLAVHVLKEPDPIPLEWYSVCDYFMLTDQIHPKNWRHNELVYDISIQFIQLPQFDPLQCITLMGDIIKLTVYRFRTTDDREQKKLVSLFLAIYNRVFKLRAFALNVLKSSLVRIIYEKEPFTSAKPILYVLSAIISKFKRPLQDEQLTIFYNILIPLHRNSHFPYFAKSLFSCIVQFLEHQHELVVDIFKVIVRDWPRMHTEKIIIFIEEIAFLSSFVEESYLVKCLQIICPQLMRSLSSCHASISEKILSMWEVNDFVWLMTVEPNVSYPLIIPTLYEVGVSYWNPEIRLITSAVLNNLRQNNEEAFIATGENLKKIKSVSIMNGLTRGAKWKYLISNYSEDSDEKISKLHTLSRLFDGLESIDPLSKQQ